MKIEHVESLMKSSEISDRSLGGATLVVLWRFRPIKIVNKGIKCKDY